MTGVFRHNYPAPGLFVADPELGYAMAPNYTGTYRKGGRAFSVRTNAEGFRDPRDFRDHDAATQRILAVGDSFVFGMPVERDQAIVAHVEHELNRLDGEGAWQVLDAGVPGYGTHQELRVIERWIETVAPSAVLLGFCLDNDVEDNRYPPQAPGSRAYHGTLVTPDVITQSQSFLFDAWYRLRLRLRSLVLYSAAETALSRLADRWTGGARAAEANPFLTLTSESWPSDLEKGWTETQRAMRGIIRLLAAHDVPFAVVVIPSKTEVLSTTSAAPSRLRRLLLDFLARHGVKTVDPTAELIAARDHGDLFEEYGTHLLEAGSEIVGVSVARALHPWLAGRPPGLPVSVHAPPLHDEENTHA